MVVFLYRSYAGIYLKGIDVSYVPELTALELGVRCPSYAVRNDKKSGFLVKYVKIIFLCSKTVFLNVFEPKLAIRLLAAFYFSAKSFFFA